MYTMPSNDDGDGAPEHKGHLPPFTPLRFHWTQDNLYEELQVSCGIQIQRTI